MNKTKETLPQLELCDDNNGGRELPNMIRRVDNKAIIAHLISRQYGPYIVRAVNAHEELVEAVKLAIEFWGKCPETGLKVDRNGRNIGNLLEAALAKAEGK